MSSGKRDAKLNKLRCLGQMERGLLANARCLVEGVDLPQLDAVAFVDPRASQVDIVQAVGRAVRKSDDKKIATIILPVFLDSHDDSEHTLEKSAFKPAWDVLKALRSHDDTLAEALDQLRRNRGEFRGKITLPGKIILNFPTTIDSSFSDAFSVTLVEQSTASWEFWFGLLRSFVTRTGNAVVRQDYQTEDGFKLGNWVSNQRANKEGLSSERRQALEDLPGWTWDALESAWDFMFGLLNKFVEQHGHAVVGKDYQTEEGFNLGGWVSRQRIIRNHLSSLRRRALEELPGWTWDALESAWDFMFGLLKAFVKQHGHAVVSQDYQTEDGFKLGVWVNYQRQRRRRNLLSSEQTQALEELPRWTWAVSESAWDFMFGLLKAFVIQNGHSRVSADYLTEDGVKLGVWVTNQRVRRERLSKEQSEALEELPGWTWAVRESAWDFMFGLLKAFVKQNEHSRVPAAYQTEKGAKLGIWVESQRTRKEGLSSARRQALEELPGWTWAARDYSWNIMFGFLKAFVKENGHSRVPGAYQTEDGSKLGSWVNSQRTRKEVLSKERRQALEELPGWTWNVLDSAWDFMFGLLKAFVNQNGHSVVNQDYQTEDGFNLGGWVRNQRTIRNRLSLVRRQALEELPGWTWAAHESRWNLMFGLLKAFVKQNDYSRVPDDYQTEDRVKLGKWVGKQRARKEGLSKERHQALEELPGWTWGVLDSAWDKGFRHLEDYYRCKGHTRVPHLYKAEDDYRLGMWVNNQRNRRKKLSPARRQALENIPGWSWQKAFDNAWDLGFERLKQFAQRERHTRVPQKYTDETDFKLGGWVSQQRQAYRQNKLSPEKQQALESVPTWVWNIIT